MRSYFQSLVLAALFFAGCKQPSEHVVLYTSVDQPVAEPIVREFERRTGIVVDMQTDTEATKSAGLAARLEAEKSNPQADVWWGNEIFHTINLAERGSLAAYDSPSAVDIPARFKDAGHMWAGTALRARVIARGTAADASARSANVAHLSDLTDPALKGKIAMARPTAGTTGGHVAALYVLWGDQKADAFFRALWANDIKVVGGNSVVADQVGQGAMWIGLTDNDDVEDAQKSGGKLDMILPDQDGQGTLTIPCTVGLVASCRHPESAKKLIDYLLSSEVEQKLLAARFGRYSVRGAAVEKIKSMEIDYRAVAKALPRAVQTATEILDGRR